MARRKNKELWEDLVDLIYLTCIYVFSKTWSKTGSLKNAFIGVILWAILLFIVVIVLKNLIRNYKNKKRLASGIDVVDKMSGEEFELFILAHFKKQGYKGYQTPPTSDYGADLVLEKDGRKIVIQAKRWNRIVGIEAVQQVTGAVKHYGAEKGMVITNNNFTENAYELANSNGIELWNRKKLIEIMEKNNGRELAVAHAQTLPNAELAAASQETCPRCGNPLILRNGKRGQFWGCSGFPKCRFTKDYSI